MQILQIEISRRLSECTSVRPSVRPSVGAHYYEE
jgi:hypothetical protein